jgi:PhoH-like ATPase
MPARPAALLDEIVSSGAEHDIAQGIASTEPSRELATWPPVPADRSHQRRSCRQFLPTAKADNQILGVVMHLGQKHPQASGDPGLQGHQHAHQGPRAGPQAQDYFNDKVLEDTDLLYTGMRELPADFWDTHGKGMESWKKDGRTYYRLKGPLCPTCWSMSSSGRKGKSRCRPSSVKVGSGKTAELETLIDYSHAKNASGASPRATASRTSPSTC